MNNKSSYCTVTSVWSWKFIWCIWKRI